MKDIKELTEKDSFILDRINETNMNKSDIALTDIPLMYSKLFEEYSNNNDDLESLKRAIFIQWYAISEPIQSTGIGELNLELQKKNLSKVVELISTKIIDIEFLAMLNHYNNITDWYFDSNLNFEDSNLSTIKSSINLSNVRGIMGRYWESILKAS